MEYNQKYQLNPEQINHMTLIKEVRFYRNGMEIVRGMKFPTPKPTIPEYRGVYEMSRKSKARLAHIVSNSDVKWMTLITLTYGDFFVPVSGKELKRQLNVFLKTFRNRFDAEYFWFMEFTKKDKPHLHIITTVEPNDLDRIWLAERWAKITVYDVWKDARLLAIPGFEYKAIDDEVMLEERQKVFNVHRHKKTWEKIRKVNGATRYMLKYAFKSEQKLVPIDFADCGRFWGNSRGVQAHLDFKLTVGKEITKEELEVIFDKVLGKEVPLIPRYLFLDDIISKLEKEGISLRQLSEKYHEDNARKSKQDMID